MNKSNLAAILLMTQTGPNRHGLTLIMISVDELVGVPFMVAFCANANRNTALSLM